MIQRKQSLYLLLAAVTMVLFYIFPIATLNTSTFSYSFYSCHLTHPKELMPPITIFPMAIIPLLSVFLSMVAIFKFNNRKLQMRIGRINLLVIAFTLLLMVYYIVKLKSIISGTINYGMAGILPVVSMILVYMANKAIKQDDDLVRSADRIR